MKLEDAAMPGVGVKDEFGAADTARQVRDVIGVRARPRRDADQHQRAMRR